MGDSPLGAALNPSVNPNISNVMTCQVNIARDHRSHTSRLSFLEQKRFLCFEKDLRFQEKIAETVGVNWEGLAAIIIFYLAVLMVKNLEEKKVIVSPFVDTCICTVRHSPGLSRMCQCADNF